MIPSGIIMKNVVSMNLHYAHIKTLNRHIDVDGSDPSESRKSAFNC